MSKSLEEIRVPRPVLIAAISLVLLTVAAVGVVRLTGSTITYGMGDATPVAERELRFEPRPGDELAVFDAKKDVLLEVLEPNTDGFIRNVVRGFGYKRRLHKVDTQSPYRLTMWSNGHLTLEDPATGSKIRRMRAFGKDQYAAFKRLLPTGSITLAKE